MVFTEEEENILKLIINELRTRKKLDKERAILEGEFRDVWNPLRAQIDANHIEAMTTLRQDFINASKAIEDAFI